MKHISCIYHTTLFFCSKKSQINFYTLLNNEDSQQKRVTKYCTNHSADIDYKYFMITYRKCTSEPYSFFTIDTALPADNPVRFRKNL